LFYYDFVNKVTDEEKDVLLVVEVDLFTIGTIILLESKILAIMAVDAKISIVVQININFVATLALGSRPKQGLTKVQAKSEAKSHISCSQECRRV
jgi:hypothetical protein